MPFVTLPTEMEMYYEVDGSGPPLLLIMGTASSHDTWDGQVAAYRHRYTCISYDARGTGRSTQTTDPTAGIALSHRNSLVDGALIFHRCIAAMKRCASTG